MLLNWLFLFSNQCIVNFLFSSKFLLEVAQWAALLDSQFLLLLLPPELPLSRAALGWLRVSVQRELSTALLCTQCGETHVP